jgi:type I restriction enzyme R subunit
MSMNEAETRAKLIDPAIHARGWTEDLIRREESPGAIEISGGRARRSRKRIDYLLRVKVNPDTQPVALALIEAKAEARPPTHGLEQAKLYADSRRLNVLFVYSSNGHLFVEFDRTTGMTSAPCPLSEFPTPAELRARYERHVGFDLSESAARPLVTPYNRGESSRRYYQDAAIRAVFEKLARGERRVLLALATGAGKTFIAVNLLRRIADAGQLRRALFICDRDELRKQASVQFQEAFGADAAVVEHGNPQKNARVLIATYQTLGIASESDDASFLIRHYPEDYFSHIIIDECHRSAWGKWSEVLRRNPSAVQIGLTATPRQLAESARNSPEALADQRITADNIQHFGEPVYEYDMAQGIEDGYLAACEIVRRDIFLDEHAETEQETGVLADDLTNKALTDARTGQSLTIEEARERYDATSFEAALLLPDRVTAMASDLFDLLCATGGPHQKTIIFCARDDHADRVAIAMNNLYAAWCQRTGFRPVEHYAFKCTAASDGSEALPDLRGGARHHFIATTVDLLTTGVDVPIVRNIVFFKYVRSPISFYQMIGRGTRLDVASGKLMFRVYDYTNATRLFGEQFLSRMAVRAEHAEPEVTEDAETEQIIEAHGFTVHVTPAGRLIVTMVDGRAMPVTLEEYEQRLAAQLVAEAPTLDAFRARWVQPPDRTALLATLPDGGQSAQIVRTLEHLEDCDLYDVLADLAYGMAPLTRDERADEFARKHAAWLDTLPAETAATLRAMAAQFVREGTDALENPHIFETPGVMRAGGLAALKTLGRPAEILMQMKQRMFAA